MSDTKQGRDLGKQIASLIDLIKRGQKQMAKASRIAAKQAQAQQDLAATVAAQGALLAKIAEKLGVVIEDEGESSNADETAQVTGLSKPLNEYTVAELREIAASEGVEVTGGMYKGDIIAALEAHFAEAAG